LWGIFEFPKGGEPLRFIKFPSICPLVTRRLRVKIIDLQEEKKKLSDQVRKKQATIEELNRRLRRLERIQKV